MSINCISAVVISFIIVFIILFLFYKFLDWKIDFAFLVVISLIASLIVAGQLSEEKYDPHTNHGLTNVIFFSIILAAIIIAFFLVIIFTVRALFG